MTGDPSMQPRQNRLLVPLIGVALGLGGWMGGDELRTRSEQRAQEIAAAEGGRPARDVGAARALAEQTAQRAATARRLIEERLAVDEQPEVLQARFIHGLRQRCQAAGAQSCLVNFTGSPAARPASGGGPVSAPRTTALADRPAVEVGLGDLGLVMSRATVTGTFQAGELVTFVRGLESDGSRGAWRVNGLVVRGAGFDLDIGQIVKPAAGSLR